jgi:hypothetical protein
MIVIPNIELNDFYLDLKGGDIIMGINDKSYSLDLHPTIWLAKVEAGKENETITNKIKARLNKCTREKLNFNYERH